MYFNKFSNKKKSNTLLQFSKLSKIIHIHNLVGKLCALFSLLRSTLESPS